MCFRIEFKTQNSLKRLIMATYDCIKCGMAVNAKCDAPLENVMLTIDAETQVQISNCPNEHGEKNHHFVVVKI